MESTGLTDVRAGTSKAAEPEKGPAALLFVPDFGGHQPLTVTDDKRSAPKSHWEVTGMSVSFLDVFTEVASSQDLPCRSYAPELFFAESPADVEYAKSLCTTCPLKAECLAGALERSEPWGVWGGELFVQGVVVPRKRPRGRPRKSDTVTAA
ncbi:WhiB family transcriptional regulator [Kribbella steppae]|uniref:WhiB family transcriptional regulator n=1 Tax=Kribbella steppae TaxID=2512223 RepID=UPI003F6E8A42